MNSLSPILVIFFSIGLGACSTPSSHQTTRVTYNEFGELSSQPTYRCSIRNFNDTYRALGETESAAKHAALERCKDSEGEFSCDERDVRCKIRNI